MATAAITIKYTNDDKIDFAFRGLLSSQSVARDTMKDKLTRPQPSMIDFLFSLSLSLSQTKNNNQLSLSLPPHF